MFVGRRSDQDRVEELPLNSPAVSHRTPSDGNNFRGEVTKLNSMNLGPTTEDQKNQKDNMIRKTEPMDTWSTEPVSMGRSKRNATDNMPYVV
jgi:hypothetical protein